MNERKDRKSEEHWLGQLLEDPLAKTMVGKKFDKLANKWRQSFSYVEHPEDLHWFSLPFSRWGIAPKWRWDNAKVFIWPAILGPYWFAYRKLYLAATLISAASLLASFALGARIQLALSIAFLVSCLWCAPAIYLCHVRDAVYRARRIANATQATAFVLARGQTSWKALTVLVVFFVAIGVAPELMRAAPELAIDSVPDTRSSQARSSPQGFVKEVQSPANASDLACDSAAVINKAKELVVGRIRNSGFYDSFHLEIKNIRVQENYSNQLLCRANAVLTNSAMLAAVGRPVFTYDATYKVERTTDGNFYMTVYPLKMLQN